MTYNTQLNQSQKLSQAKDRHRINPATPANSPKPEPPPKTRGLTLRAKAMLVAIAIGVVPVTVVGTIAHNIAKNAVTKQISQAQLDRTKFLARSFDLFLEERVREAEVLASEQIFTNPNINRIATTNQKKAALDAFQDRIGYYDSIVYLDLAGNPLFQSRSNRPLRTNYSDSQYFQKAIATRQTTMNGPGLSDLTAQLRVEFAVPVKHAWTDRVIGVMRFRIPGEQMNPLFTSYVANNEQWHLIDSEGVFFASSLPNFLNQPVVRYYPQLARLHEDRETDIKIYDHPRLENEKQLISYAPGGMRGINNTNLGAVLAIDTDTALAPLDRLWWTFFGGTLTTALVVGAIAAYLANRITRPLAQLDKAVNRLSLGQLDTRVPVSQTDEISMLGAKINQMAEHLHHLVKRQKDVSKTSELMSNIAQAASLRELQPPLNRFLTEIRVAIKADRLIFYQFNEQWQGAVIAESVGQGWPRTIGVEFNDPSFAQDHLSNYQRGRIQAISDIYEANLSASYIQQLEPYDVIANLVIPVIADRLPEKQSEKLIGLLIAHQCSESRVWQQPEVEKLQQTSYQLSTILRGYISLQREYKSRIALQGDIKQLLDQIKHLADGDLTVTATTDNEALKDIAELFNTITNNLRLAMVQIQVNASQIDHNLTEDQKNQAQLKEELDEQAHRLIIAFSFVEQITNSIQEVAESVGIASQTVNLATVKVESGQANLNMAIENITQLQEVVKNTTEKIKQIETSSQEMSRVIALVGQLNLRGSILNGKLEERLSGGEELASIVKEEKGSIQQSIAATKELVKISDTIKNNLIEVLRDLEVGTAKILGGDRLAAEANKNLEQVTIATQDTQKLLQSIANTSNAQIHSGQQVADLRHSIDRSIERTTSISDRTETSLDDTAHKISNLQKTADSFKIEKIEDIVTTNDSE